MKPDQLDSFKACRDGGRRKPRIALMGEFSAGKSTLLNMLLASNPLPVRVTATSLPPVWMSYGEEMAIRIRMDGTEEEFDLADLNDIGLDDTQCIRLSLQADALEICDLFDMPGISDPNMSSEVWKRVFDKVDSVIWCTHATQAWRQSEAATWAEISDQTNGENILVITQFDKIRSDRDRARLVARVKKETQDAFKGVFPLALIDAINAADEDGWHESGAAAFSEHLVEMLLKQDSTVETRKPGRKATSDTVLLDVGYNTKPVLPFDDQPKEKIVPRRVTPRQTRARRDRTLSQELPDRPI